MSESDPTPDESIPEPDFQEQLAEWFSDRYGSENVHTEHYQPGPRWYCDIVVETDYATLYVECKTASAGDSGVRSAIAQALGYASECRATGVPMVAVPKGVLADDRIKRLRQATTVVIREFDHENGGFV